MIRVQLKKSTRQLKNYNENLRMFLMIVELAVVEDNNLVLKILLLRKIPLIENHNDIE